MLERGQLGRAIASREQVVHLLEVFIATPLGMGKCQGGNELPQPFKGIIARAWPVQHVCALWQGLLSLEKRCGSRRYVLLGRRCLRQAILNAKGQDG